MIKRSNPGNGYGVASTGKASRAPLVLIVDDDDSLRLLCRVNLELDGYRVEIERALEAGVAKAEIARTLGVSRGTLNDSLDRWG